MEKMRWTRIISFASVILLIYSISFVYSITTLMDSTELAWLLQNPWITLNTIFRWLTRNPIIMLTLLGMTVNSFILGFLIDWGLRFLQKHIKLRWWQE